MKLSEKNIVYDNLKNHEKQAFSLSLENTFLEKPEKGGR